MVVIYRNFAYYYDLLMDEVDYGAWADYIEEIFKKMGLRASLIADLGCGTASFCIEMSKRGYEMIGIDISQDMLSVAKEKAIEKDADILLLNQDISEFELYGSVDAIVCLMDSVNYITDADALKNTFKLVENYLNPGGLFIFDVNSEYKFEHILADNVFYHVSDDITYIWQNEYNKKEKSCVFDLTFFARTGELYKRFDEIHIERAYSRTELEEMLNAVALELCGVYGEFSFDEAGPECERLFFVSKKSIE